MTFFALQRGRLIIRFTRNYVIPFISVIFFRALFFSVWKSAVSATLRRSDTRKDRNTIRRSIRCLGVWAVERRSTAYPSFIAQVIITTAGELSRRGDGSGNDPSGTRSSPCTVAPWLEITSASELVTLFANLAQSEHCFIEGGIKLENEWVFNFQIINQGI